MESFLLSLPALAVALFLCLVGVRYTRSLGLPKVTVFLLAGLALGPNVLLRFFDAESVFGRFLLTDASRPTFDLVKFLAIGFILFRVGGEFRIPTLRRLGPRILLLSSSEILATFALVFLAVFAVSGSLGLALIAPLLATSTAPSATLLTLRELESEGPATRCTMILVGMNNLFTLLLFPIVLALDLTHAGPLSATGVSLIAIGGGLALGLGAALALESFSMPTDQPVLGVLLVLACLGLAHAIEPASAFSNSMLCCFAAGVVVSNASPHAGELQGSLERVVFPLYVLFFVGSGRELHLESVGEAGVLGLAFVAARIAGKLLGTRIGLRLSGWGEELPGFLGNGMLCQAGVALGLVVALGSVPGTHELRNVALASVVFFEVLGPILTRRTVIKAGEVKLASFIELKVPSSSPIRDVGNELRQSLGHFGIDKSAEDQSLTVRLVMRRRPELVPPDMDFDRVLKVLGEADTDLLPVVDDEKVLKGVISSHDIREILYDPTLRDLVIAADLMSPVTQHLTPETS
ncbi:MAG: cation:proton antiporter, partial [Planctomycetota bacterium]